jgi:hypothetical protein
MVIRTIRLSERGLEFGDLRMVESTVECEAEAARSLQVYWQGVIYAGFVLVEISMDFIERWFGFSPDGGDGSTELLYIVAAAVLLGLFVGRRHLAKFVGRRRA